MHERWRLLRLAHVSFGALLHGVGGRVVHHQRRLHDRSHLQHGHLQLDEHVRERGHVVLGQRVALLRFADVPRWRWRGVGHLLHGLGLGLRLGVGVLQRRGLHGRPLR